MILGDKDILDRLRLEDGDAKKLCIEPFIEDHLQSASYDITLSNSFTVRRKSDKPIDIKKPIGGNRRLYRDTFTLFPKDFVLATTIESIIIPNDLGVWVQGRSSMGRLGIFIQNAGWVDPGFNGEITLELYNAGKSPVTLEKGMRIGQLIFAETGIVLSPYNGKYQGQRGATSSKIFEDYEEG